MPTNLTQDPSRRAAFNFCLGPDYQDIGITNGVFGKISGLEGGHIPQSFESLLNERNITIDYKLHSLFPLRVENSLFVDSPVRVGAEEIALALKEVRWKPFAPVSIVVRQ